MTKDLINFMNSEAFTLDAEGRSGTAHIRRAVSRSLSVYMGGGRLEFAAVNVAFLKSYQRWLLERSLSMNTVSTYLRCMRACYNHAVDEGLARYAPRLFSQVYTGTKMGCKRALEPGAMAKFLNADASLLPGKLQPALVCFVLMFLLRGIPFVDLVHLRKDDLRNGVITYRRQKTKRSLTVCVPREALELIGKYRDRNPDSPYLLSVLGGNISGFRAEYEHYQQVLRYYNRNLASLGRLLGVGSHISTYTARHTWATTAFHQNVSLGMISNALGHSSVRVTETYLKPFGDKEVDRENKRIITYIKRIREDGFLRKL